MTEAGPPAAAGHAWNGPIAPAAPWAARLREAARALA